MNIANCIDRNYHKGADNHGQRTMIKYKTLFGKDTNPTIRNGGENTYTEKHNWNTVIQINDSKESGCKQPYQQNRIYDTDGIIPALSSELNGRTNIQIKSDLLQGNIRRLTEHECENLQGFPSDWTKFGLYPTKKVTQERINKMSNEELLSLFNTTILKEISPTQRYKLCGNSVTRDIVELIGIKLLSNE